MTAVTHKLVPCDPTLEMIERARRDWMHNHGPESRTLHGENIVGIYRAMIAAAPASPSLPSSSGISEVMRTKIARAMCGDDHLQCTYPECKCNVIPRRLPAVIAIIEAELTAPISDKETT